MADYIYMLESRLTPEQQRGVKLVQDVARAHSMNIYLVGGIVRDMFSGAAVKDLDFAVQGNPLKLHKDLEKAGAVVEGSDEHYKTLYVLLPGNLRGEITATRSEKYDKPGKPPEISPATINDDVRRRDFTMNAMALSLNPGSRGLMIDPFNGVADLESKIIRILHNYAFLEEPSRLIRATRFAARFDWQLEERTQIRYNAAKENNYIEHLNKKLVGHEVEQIAHENDPLKTMKALEREGWLEYLHPHWNSSKVDTTGLHDLLKVRQQLVETGYTLESGPAVMYFLTSKLNSTDEQQLKSMIARKSFVAAWNALEGEAKEFTKRMTGKEANTASDTWKLLSRSKPETILFTTATTSNAQVTRKVNDFLGKWRQTRQRFPLPEMTELRITPELPEYPKLAEDVFYMLIDNRLKTQEQIIAYLKPFSPPEPVAPPPPPRRGRVKKAEGKTAAKTTAANGETAAPGEAMAPKKRGRKPAVEAAPLAAAAQAVGGALGKVVNAAKSVIGTEKTAPAAIKKAVAEVKKAVAAVKPAPKKAPPKAKAKSAKKAPAAKSARGAKKSPAKKTAKKK